MQVQDEFTTQCPDTGCAIKFEVEWDEYTGKVNTFGVECVDDPLNHSDPAEAERYIKETEEWCRTILDLGKPFGVESLVNRLKFYGVDTFDIPVEMLNWRG